MRRRSPMGDMRPKRIVVGMTGASGSIFGVRLLQALAQMEVESHLVMTEWAKRTLRIETDFTEQDVAAMASRAYRIDNLAAAISSGSFRTDGMVILPCSMNTVASIAHGLSDNLLTRAADVTLKERAPLVVVPRETPLTLIHLRNLVTLTEAGARVVPPVPGFYNRPRDVDDIVWHIVARILDQLGIDNDLTRRWGPSAAVPPLDISELQAPLPESPAPSRSDHRETP